MRDRRNPDHRFCGAVVRGKSVWAGALAEETDYDNFKTEVERYQGAKGKRYAAALHEVWGVMCESQR